MRRLIVTGPDAVVARWGAYNWIACQGDSDIFDVPADSYDRAIAAGKQLGLTIEEQIADKILVRVGPSVHCFCGEKLHYTVPAIQEQCTNLCKVLGEYVQVTTPAGSFAVPRHYVFLHGIKGAEVPTMGFERWTKAMG